MPHLIPFAEVGHLFTEFEHTAWRLETRQGYASDRQGARFQMFLRGVQPRPEPDHPWNVNVRAQTRLGKRFARVRIIDDPPTDGQRFLLATAAANVEAGEDIRILARDEARRLGLPGHDVWLFDSRILVRIHHDGADATLGVEVTDDPARVLRIRRARDAAWCRATPTAQVWARVRSTV
ncbi:DUF6879 family protein [Streptomyces sp. NPDC088725]|uniref:DUF6879 family protein n=1 Tax=Streptomyces sp. NPDC088725 TaxID=3365873 RepID=UPI00381ECA80